MSNFFSNLIHSTSQHCQKTMLLIMLGSFFSGNLSSQTFTCGTPDVITPELEDVFSSVANNAQVAGLIPSRKIPLWIYFLRSNTGASTYTLDEIKSHVTEINIWYSGLFEFVVCGSSVIDSDTYYPTLTTANEYSTMYEIAKTLGLPGSDNAIKVFYAESLEVGTDTYGGVAYNPVLHPNSHGIVVAQHSARVLAHELGHYFQLLHTFNGTITQIVNLGEPECHQNGDRICDTPADPGDKICTSGGCGSNFNCSQTDPLGVPYNPDGTLIMSYFQCTPAKFSTDQKTVMNYVLTTNPNAYAHLTGPGALDCIIPKKGTLVRDCSDYEPDLPPGLLPLANEPVVVANGYTNNTICGPITDINGEYESVACNLNINQLHIIRPDKNYDGNLIKGVDVADIVLIKEYYLYGSVNFGPIQLIAADADNSGTVGPYDRLLINRVIKSNGNGMYTYPAGNWKFLPQYWLLFPTFKANFTDGNPFDASVFDSGTQTFRTYNPTNPFDSWMDLMRITPNSLAGTHDEAWSFFCIKTGDLNCSADLEEEETPSDVGSFLVPLGANTAQGLNDIKEYNVILNTNELISGWQFGAKFPSNSLDILEILEGSVGDQFDLENFDISENIQSSEGYLKALWSSEDAYPKNLNNKILFKLKIRAKTPFGQLENLLLIHPDALKMVFYNGNLEKVTNVSLSLVPANNGTEERNVDLNTPLFSVSPTLLNDFVNFKFNLPTNETVAILVTDFSGKHIVNHSQKIDRGIQSIKIDNLSSLPPGTYFYQIRIGKGVQTGKLIKS